MTVTVVIVNYNAGEMLAKSVASLGKQTLYPDRIILIDNGSTDGSVEKVPQIDKLEIQLMNANLGFAKGNNHAFRQIDTEFIALLNPDAFAEPEWLENLMKAARDFPKVGAFGSRQLSDSDPAIIDDIGDAYHVSGLAWQTAHDIRQRPDHLVGREIFTPCAAASFYRKSVLDEVGELDEDFFCYMEDVDLGFRIRLAGYPIRYVPDAVVRHVGSATSGGKQSDFAVYYGYRNQLWTFVRNMPGPLFWIFFPAHIAVTCILILLFSKKGRWRVILRSKRDAFKGLPLAWQKRKETQAKRKASVADIWRLLDKRWIPRPHGD